MEEYIHPSVVEISIMCWSEAGVNDSAMDLGRIVRIPRSSILDGSLLYNTSCLVAVNCESTDCETSDPLSIRNSITSSATKKRSVPVTLESAGMESET